VGELRGVPLGLVGGGDQTRRVLVHLLEPAEAARQPVPALLDRSVDEHLDRMLPAHRELLLDGFEGIEADRRLEPLRQHLDRPDPVDAEHPTRVLVV